MEGLNLSISQMSDAITQMKNSLGRTKEAASEVESQAQRAMKQRDKYVLLHFNWPKTYLCRYRDRLDTLERRLVEVIETREVFNPKEDPNVPKTKEEIREHRDKMIPLNEEDIEKVCAGFWLV